MEQICDFCGESLYIEEWFDSLCNLFRMIDEELAVVHAREYFDVGLRAEGEEVSHLRFGNKGFFGAVPEMDVRAVDGL